MSTSVGRTARSARSCGLRKWTFGGRRERLRVVLSRRVVLGYRNGGVRRVPVVPVVIRRPRQAVLPALRPAISGMRLRPANHPAMLHAAVGRIPADRPQLDLSIGSLPSLLLRHQASEWGKDKVVSSRVARSRCPVPRSKQGAPCFPAQARGSTRSAGIAACEALSGVRRVGTSDGRGGPKGKVLLPREARARREAAHALERCACDDFSRHRTRSAGSLPGPRGLSPPRLVLDLVLTDSCARWARPTDPVKSDGRPRFCKLRRRSLPPLQAPWCPRQGRSRGRGGGQASTVKARLQLHRHCPTRLGAPVPAMQLSAIQLGGGGAIAARVRGGETGRGEGPLEEGIHASGAKSDLPAKNGFLFSWYKNGKKTCFRVLKNFRLFKKSTPSPAASYRGPSLSLPTAPV